MIIAEYACALMIEDESAAFPLALQVYHNSSTGDAIASAIRKRTSLLRDPAELAKYQLKVLLTEIVNECRMSKL